MNNNELIVTAAQLIMNWSVEKVPGGFAIGEAGAPTPLFHIWDKWRNTAWNPVESATDAFNVVDRLTHMGFEVIIGCFEKSTSVEIRRWRDRRTEGIPGDPCTGRSRETIVSENGTDRLRTIVEACVRAVRETRA